MDAATKQLSDFDTVHLPPLTAGERVRCSYADPESLIKVGVVYTIKSNCRPPAKERLANEIDLVELLEVAGKKFQEIFFDRIN